MTHINDHQSQAEFERDCADYRARQWGRAAIVCVLAFCLLSVFFAEGANWVGRSLIVMLSIGMGRLAYKHWE